LSDAHAIHSWFLERIPATWFCAPPESRVDRDEIVIMGSLALRSELRGDTHAQLEILRRFRDKTRLERIRMGHEAETLFGRQVSWGATCGTAQEMFSTVGLPVMTRLHMDERAVLDALVEAGVARTRSQALAWCVKLVHKHEGTWIGELKQAVSRVEEIRDAGPQL